MDALSKVFADAARRGDTVPVDYVHKFGTATATKNSPPVSPATNHSRSTPKTFRCETINGTPLDPTETFANSLMSRLRRVIVDAKGVVIDLGQARLFNGNSRHAVKLTSTTCVWPGCHAPVSNAEIDHMHEHTNGGHTTEPMV